LLPPAAASTRCLPPKPFSDNFAEGLSCPLPVALFVAIEPMTSRTDQPIRQQHIVAKNGSNGRAFCRHFTVRLVSRRILNSSLRVSPRFPVAILQEICRFRASFPNIGRNQARVDEIRDLATGDWESVVVGWQSVELQRVTKPVA